MQVETLDATVVDYINEIKTNFENQIKEVKEHFEHQIHKLKNEVIEYHNKYLEIKERYDLLIYKRFMRSAEQIPIDAKQELLFTSESEPAEITAKTEERVEVASYQRAKRGRKPIDPNIPREETIIDIPEEEKTCACGAKMTKIGEETSEKLQFIPMRIYVEKTIRPKYACRCCEGTEDEEAPTVRIAPVPPSIIPRSIASPSLLSAIFTHKFQDHLPYYWQERQFGRIGVDISRQDMSNWQQQAYSKLTPLFDLMKETVKSGPVLQMDETTVQVIGEQGGTR